MTLYDFSLPGIAGGVLDLAQYRGQPILLANTASKCGFTPQYAGLQRLWERFSGQGLVVVGVPSNDFGGQEPGGEADIQGFCCKNYGVTFPLSAKLDVAGANAHPLFRDLAAQGGALSRPRWNFYKYLLGRDGRLLTWFSSLTRPESGRVTRAIERALA